MYPQLVSHNDDIRRLVQKGYAVAIDNNYLIVRDIPYLDITGSPQIGAIVSKLVFKDQEEHVALQNHEIFFAGAVPYGLDHNPISNLGGGPATLALSEKCKDVVVQRSFSNKPKVAGNFRDYIDFFEKIESYVSIICGPAMSIPGVSPYTFREVNNVSTESVFKIRDTLSSLAEITDLSAKFKDDVIAIIGLGGTGAYILDFLIKTPVKEIRAFDPDLFYVHNAFRSPGKLDTATELNKPKAEVYGSRYESFRNGLTINSKRIDNTCLADLNGVTFAFICVDKGSSRAQIFELLISHHIPFIDVGMGLDRKNGALNGMIRATYCSSDDIHNIKSKGIPLIDTPDDAYQSNIQIGELNALNACLAIIKYKQIRGFYFENPASYNILLTLEDLKIFTE